MSDYILIDGTLYHHGILGQKWGKRNGPPYPLKESKHSKAEKDAQNNRVSKETLKKVLLGTAIFAGVGGAIYLGTKYNALSKILEFNKSKGIGKVDDIDDYLDKYKNEINNIVDESLDETTQIITEGTILHRIDIDNKFDSEQIGDHLYVTNNNLDNDAYKVFFKAKIKDVDRIDTTLKLTEDLRIPSDTKAKQIFEKVFNDNDYQEKMIETYMKALEKRQPEIFKNNPSYARAQAIRIIIGDSFKSGINSIHLNGEDGKILIKAYKDAGYNAVKDYYDKGTLSDNSLIIFDPANKLEKIGEKYVKEKDRISALANLIENNHVSIRTFVENNSIEKSTNNEKLQEEIKNIVIKK